MIAFASKIPTHVFLLQIFRPSPNGPFIPPFFDVFEALIDEPLLELRWSCGVYSDHSTGLTLLIRPIQERGPLKRPVHIWRGHVDIFTVLEDERPY